MGEVRSSDPVPAEATNFYRFKNENPDALPDSDTLQEFMWWYAQRSKGKINERATVSVLLFNFQRFVFMYNCWYKHQIPKEVQEEVYEVRKFCSYVSLLIFAVYSNRVARRH